MFSLHSIIKVAGQILPLYTTVEEIAVASPLEISAATEISENIAAKIIVATRKLANVGDFETGDKVFERRQNVSKITTGSGELDGCSVAVPTSELNTLEGEL